jgi:hypothetical protein
MTKTTIGGLVAGLALAIAMMMPSAGCGGGGGGGGVIEELCELGVTCGIDATYGECVDYMEDCTDELTDNQRDDWMEQIEECLERSTCGGAIDCYNQVPWC